MLGLVAFGAAVPAASGVRFLREILLASAVSLVAALNLWLAARAAPGDALRRLAAAAESRLTLRGDGDARAWDRALPWAIAAWVTLVAATLAVLVFERIPHIDDSVSYQFQAKVMATGRLWLPAPPDSASFHMDEVIVDGGRWFGYAFPAWPAVLAVGTALGVPWLVNPVLGGLLVLLGHALARRLYGRGAANAVVLLMAASPWLLWMSAEFMGHPLSAVLAMAALLAGVRARDDGGWRWGILSGAALGALFLVRPLDGLLVTAVGAAWTVRELGWRRATGPLAAGGLAAVAVGALIFPYNAALTGRATYAPHMMWTDRTWGAGVDRLGFGADIGIPAWTNSDPLAGHGAADVVLNWNKNVFGANTELFGWAAGSLLLLWLALGARGWRRADALPAGIVLAFVLAHAFYWFSGGPDLGPRYWYPVLVPLAMLTVRAASLVAARLPATTDAAGERLGATLVLAAIGALLLFMPWRVTKYHRYREVSGDARRLAARHGFGRSLVFVRSTEREDYQSGYSLNPTDLEADVPIYVRDAGATNRARVVARFPDRTVWVIGRRDRDVPVLELFEGPLPPGTVPR